MKKLNLFLLVAGFFVFSSCTERLEHNEEKSSGNVVINLSSVNAERGAVPDGYRSVDISKVEEWTLTFSLVPPFDKFPAEVKTINGNTTGSFTIGVGEYDLLVEGSYTEPGDNGGFTYNLRGTCSGIVVEEGNKNTVPVSILVGPKKTTEGKGSFSAEMSFMQDGLATYYNKTIGLSPNASTVEKSKRFKAELVSRKTGEIVYSTHSGEKLLFADAVSTDSADTGDSYVTVKSDPNKISSGYYYFHFYADFASVNQNDPSAETAPDWKEVSIGDNLVEIGDGLSTSMECTSLSLANDTPTYYYYASDDGSEENNGISLNARGELYAVLDTIYNNPMVQKAEIKYTYTDSIKFDVSKIGSGKTVEIICTKKDSQEGGGDTPSFTLNEDSSVLFNMYAESITLTSTGDAKGVKIKENINANSSTTISLENGVYLDLTSLTAEELGNLSLRFRLDDANVDYYKNNPMMVSSVSLGTDQGANYIFAFDTDYSQFPSETYSYNKGAVFTYNMKEDSGTGRYNYFAEEPEFVGVVYYSNDQSIASYKIELENNNGAYADITTPDYENPDPAALASWCDDGKNGFYVFEISGIKTVGDYNQKHLPDNPVYNIRHFEKIKKGTSFIFNQTKINCNIKEIPVSMCTDGTNIYYVQSKADISMYGGKSFELYNWGHWAYLGNKVKYFSVENPSAQNELNFSSVFTDGKVTAVYYYNNELYVAGYKKDYIGSVYGNQEQSAQEIKFYNCTYSVYKLSNPKDVTTAKPVSNVFDSSGEKDRVPGILEIGKITDDDRIIAYSAITDMAIVDGNLYVLENSYYRITSTYGYGFRGSLRQVSLESGNVLKVLDENSKNEKVGLPYKIIAVLPKKLKISDNKKKNASQSKNSTYDVDLSASDLSLEEEEEVRASGYCFDNYDAAGSSLIYSDTFDTFKTEGIYTVPSKKDIENNAFTPN